MFLAWREHSGVTRLPDAEFAGMLGDSATVLWLDLAGGEAEIRPVLTGLKLFHPLTIERLFTPQPRAFLDEYQDYLHLLLQEIHWDAEGAVELRGCHFLIGANFLITVHAGPLEALRELPPDPPARFFSQGSDILCYHLAAPLISQGFKVLDEVADRTEALEDRIFPKPDRELLTELFALKRKLIAMRKALAPMREALALLSRRENPFVDLEALPFMSLLYDQVIRVHELCETQRDILAGAQEIYLSALSNRMNEVMMTLTVVSTIILPLTLIVGYYGMNFRHFPELAWPHGLLFLWLVMAGTVAGLLWYFKRKHWF
ncbi:magnesium transporter [Hydrogenispora ethanolica]|uniref:Magnesium transport protein CorA n=1 Tax=Hydrogenispora ethanolica TaxID=1082276 RepID=A0A4R1S297_HYDET|nr:magnesium/cobalt transporter CorA [Hydrogenispora ethanolica]TCL73305.1 magnesium transporter [Hydrogenispora ethanolica]